uniref:LicD family protein n=1 Tax=Microbulbifer agarilyticus TaxID=260552 RepID=UPI00031B9624|nr:LicD family protein [Microbulbifer agarilyticus]
MIAKFVRSIFGQHQEGSARSRWSENYLGPAIYGIDTMPFEIYVGKKVSEIKIELADTNHLHLADVLFNIHNKWASLKDYENLSFEQSSIVKNDKIFDVASLANGASAFFSTRMEENPHVIVRFPHDVELDALRIVNRRDGLWHRARNLGVSVCTNGRWLPVYDGSDSQSRLSWLKRAVEVLPDSDSPTEDVCNLLSELRACVCTGPLAVESCYGAIERFGAEYKFPSSSIESVDFFSSGLARSLSRVFSFFESRLSFIVARFSINMLVCHGYRRDAFRLYAIAARSLSESELKCIEEDVEVIGQQKYKHPLIPAAHTFARPLSSYPREILLDTIDAVVKCLDDPDRALLLCYGTLLGFYRDNDFIAHDDDIDLLCITSVGREGLYEVATQIVEILSGAGFRAQINFNNRREGLPFIQVFSQSHRVHLDIFLAFESGGELMLPMRNVNYSSVPAPVLQPAATKEFFGREYKVPADIEGFLVARYGVSWNVPDKHFRANEHGKR